jgi:hypothetical protein
MTRIAALVLLFLITAIDALAQQSVSFTPLDGLARDLKNELARQISADEKRAEIASLLQEHTQELALYSLGASVYATLVEEERLDKQIGSSSSSSGSTSLVSRGSVPSIVGVAVDSGALYQSVSGNVVTFRLNPSGLARALVKNSYWASGPALSPTAMEDGLRRISASASFDFTEGSSAGAFTAERSQLKEAALRIEIVNKRDPRHPSHRDAIRQVRANMAPLVAAVTAFFDTLKKMPGYDEWRIDTAVSLTSVDISDDDDLKSALDSVADDFTARFASNPELKNLANSMVEGIKSYRTVRDNVFQNIKRSSAFTFEYAFNRMTLPETAFAALPGGTIVPDLSTGRLIFSSPLGGVGEATLNGSATFFNSTRPEMSGSLRDVQVAGSLDFRLPEIQGVGKPVLTLAGLEVFLHQQPFGVKVRIRDIETDKGAIGVFQGKLTFPAGKSGVQIPVSLTMANRSEFNTEREVRGAIGFTFDMDKLFSR